MNTYEFIEKCDTAVECDAYTQYVYFINSDTRIEIVKYSSNLMSIGIFCKENINQIWCSEIEISSSEFGTEISFFENGHFIGSEHLRKIKIEE